MILNSLLKNFRFYTYPLLIVSFSILNITFTFAGEETDDTPTIWAIKIIGNRITSNELIRREMTLKPGMVADKEAIEKDRLRLMSLGLFNYVDISLSSDLGRAVLIVKVSEKLYIYPYPIFDYDPLEPRKRVFGIRLRHDNLRGTGEQLSLAWWNGYQQGISFLHRDPWFSIGGRYGVRLMGLYNQREIKNPEDGQYVKTTKELLLVRIKHRISYELWMGVEVQWEEHSSKAQFYTISNKGRDKLISGRILLEKDKRDYVFYPKEGYFITAVIEGNRMVDTTHTFFHQQIDARIYHTLNNLTLAGRIWLDNSQDSLPYYRRLELTTNEIRSNDIWGLTGLRTIALNCEFRFNIIPLTYFNLPNWYLIGPYLQNLKFSTEGLIFFDYGYVQTGTKNGRYLSALGLGCQFQIPHLEIGKILLGWDRSDKFSTPLLILGINVTF